MEKNMQEWIYYKSESYFMEYGYRGYKFVSIDYFLETHSGETKEVKKEHVTNQGNYDQRPDWCKVIKNKIYE